ncbi:hypothetical protein FCM35_KLT17989 [Carex littledalei]|uniref:Uncharacterized protein n=1 Tax=Carex littledalei TaxID=544730 RepID=A0A833REK2_9POAL|nr:hypothetical protein FCM35_KLT17989 [Carex littledalei]
MQPHSRQNHNPNPNSNHRHDQYHRHCHHHCTHHPPFPHVHISVLFCPHHHHHLHLHHLHFHATQLPCNFSLPSSSSSLSPLPHLQAFSNQTSQGPEISHATVSDLEFPPQELAASNILEDNEEEEEDVYVLTDEWAEFFAKSEAKRQLGSTRIMFVGHKFFCWLNNDKNAPKHLVHFDKCKMGILVIYFFVKIFFQLIYQVLVTRMSIWFSKDNTYKCLSFISKALMALSSSLL